ncbi:Hypothetical protein NGAL_HAMBI1146_42800 [Neorhizobium galegae bv. officinalis]|nr:Hypothetical protein NGAL_HAMBI490_26610 [Neorhizobium galegae bv. officinalis]CDZ41276.1 Hypothetical protein NGAL_HAMBI1146_42800 [Neorhizobium galegae bv. officinalis]
MSGALPSCVRNQVVVDAQGPFDPAQACPVDRHAIVAHELLGRIWLRRHSVPQACRERRGNDQSPQCSCGCALETRPRRESSLPLVVRGQLKKLSESRSVRSLRRTRLHEARIQGTRRGLFGNPNVPLMIREEVMTDDKGCNGVGPRMSQDRLVVRVTGDCTTLPHQRMQIRNEGRGHVRLLAVSSLERNRRRDRGAATFQLSACPESELPKSHGHLAQSFAGFALAIQRPEREGFGDERNRVRKPTSPIKPARGRWAFR